MSNSMDSLNKVSGPSRFDCLAFCILLLEISLMQLKAIWQSWQLRGSVVFSSFCICAHVRIPCALWLRHSCTCFEHELAACFGLTVHHPGSFPHPFPSLSTIYSVWLRSASLFCVGAHGWVAWICHGPCSHHCAIPALITVPSLLPSLCHPCSHHCSVPAPITLPSLLSSIMQGSMLPSLCHPHSHHCGPGPCSHHCVIPTPITVPFLPVIS